MQTVQSLKKLNAARYEVFYSVKCNCGGCYDDSVCLCNTCYKPVEQCFCIICCVKDCNTAIKEGSYMNMCDTCFKSNKKNSVLFTVQKVNRLKKEAELHAKRAVELKAEAEKLERILQNI